MRAVLRHVAPLLALLATCSTASAGAGQGQAAQDPQQPQAPRIRVSVDVVAVDVQVLDSTGRPVPNLGPEKFSVTINGRRRRVVRPSRSATKAPGPPATGRPRRRTRPSSAPERVIMIAVDCISFDTGAVARSHPERPARSSAGWSPTTTSGCRRIRTARSSRRRPTMPRSCARSTRWSGSATAPASTAFTCGRAKIIDANRDLDGRRRHARRDRRRECGDRTRSELPLPARGRGHQPALYYEGQATASLGMLRTLVTQMQRYPGRKTLLLVSGGMIASDSPGGRPDLGGLGIQVGKEAAAANTAIYTLYIDSTLHDRFGAETRNGDRTATTSSRSGGPGALAGAVHRCGRRRAVLRSARQRRGGVRPGFRRSSRPYYLLGVEPADEDRDGRTHEVAVKVDAAEPHDSRPALGDGPHAKRLPPPGCRRRRRRRPHRPAGRRHPRRRRRGARSPPEVRRWPTFSIAATMPRFRRRSARSTICRTRCAAFRQSDSPWPENRRRTAVFALELAARRPAQRQSRCARRGRQAARRIWRAGARAGRRRCVRVLVVRHRSVVARRAVHAGERAALHSAERCSAARTTPRLRLAHASCRSSSGCAAGRLPVQEAEILNLYEAGDEVSGDRDRSARPRRTLSLRNGPVRSRRSRCCRGSPRPLRISSCATSLT